MESITYQTYVTPHELCIIHFTTHVSISNIYIENIKGTPSYDAGKIKEQTRHVHYLVFLTKSLNFTNLWALSRACCNPQTWRPPGILFIVYRQKETRMILQIIHKDILFGENNFRINAHPTEGAGDLKRS